MTSLFYNLHIEQGATFHQEFSFNTLITVLCDSLLPISSLHVDPLQSDLPDNFELVIDCNNSIYTNGISLLGSQTLSIKTNTYPNKIKANTTFKGTPLDFSVGIWEGIIKSPDKLTILATLNVTGTNQGKITLDYPYQLTANLPGNIDKTVFLNNSPDKIINNIDLIKKYLKVAYPYQVEHTVGSICERRLEGYVFVTGDLTP